VSEETQVYPGAYCVVCKAAVCTEEGCTSPGHNDSVAYRVALTAGSTQEDEDASVTGVYGACEALAALRGARP
jgi:hypothetical protein